MNTTDIRVRFAPPASDEPLRDTESALRNCLSNAAVTLAERLPEEAAGAAIDKLEEVLAAGLAKLPKPEVPAAPASSEPETVTDPPAGAEATNG